jgi:hypothetical protein
MITNPITRKTPISQTSQQTRNSSPCSTGNGRLAGNRLVQSEIIVSSNRFPIMKSSGFFHHSTSQLLIAAALTGFAVAAPSSKKQPKDTRPKVSMAFWITEGQQAVKIPPTQANVAYGTDKMQVMDFWKAESSKPTPLVFFIHGGSWRSNDKDKVTGIREYLAAGISVVSINYRFVQQAQAAGIEPPVKWPLEDAARALQFVRSKAAGWNIDKNRIGASGGSAGACSSLWLAFHDDMADPNSSDPIARESTRLSCAGVVGAQTTLDPKQMKEWTSNSVYGGHAFGFNGDKAKEIPAFRQFLRIAIRSFPGSTSIHPGISSQPMIRRCIFIIPTRQ